MSASYVLIARSPMRWLAGSAATSSWRLPTPSTPSSSSGDGPRIDAVAAAPACKREPPARANNLLTTSPVRGFDARV